MEHVFYNFKCKYRKYLKNIKLIKNKTKIRENKTNKKEANEWLLYKSIALV